MIATPDLNTREGLLAQLLTGTVQALDLPADLRAHASWRFNEIGTHLNNHGDSLGGAPWDVYPQGAFLLGTVISPIGAEGGYDVDLVCLRHIEPISTTRAGLKADTGRALADYVKVARRGPVSLEEGKRCWTLKEPQRQFHADVLPAIPDPEGSVTGILLTDKQDSRWLHSDPKGYAAWFKERMKVEFLARVTKMAEARASTIEAIPEEEVKTTLQMAVQALKRHRDMYFQNDPEMTPPSILITTLAAHAYQGDQNLFEAVVMMADAMPRYIEYDGVEWCVRNPVQHAENFADRWRTEPGRQRAFMGWLETLKRDLDEMHRIQGIPVLFERVAKSFGESPVRTSVEGLGGKYKGLSDRGALGMAIGSGTLSIATPNTRKVREHGFYGAEDSDS